MSNPILQDERVQWLRQKVVMAFDMPTTAFDEYFTESLSRAKAAQEAQVLIKQFLSDKYGSGNAIFFSSKVSSETIITEISQTNPG